MLPCYRKALGEVRKLQRDEIKRGSLRFTPPTDTDDLLDFWADRIMGRYAFPCGPSSRELRVLGLLHNALIEAREAAQ
jgi:hypothetical protein